MYCVNLLLTFSFFSSHRQAKKYLWLALLGLLAVHAVKTHVRNFDWRDEYTIFTAGLKVGVSGRRRGSDVRNPQEI